MASTWVWCWPGRCRRCDRLYPRWRALGGVGAVFGAVAGAFAPSLSEGLRERSATQQSWRDSIEKPISYSLARLLDPRRELVDFVGREDEMTALLAWCEDDQATRLRLVTGPGGVGKTRLAVQLEQRAKELGWVCERVADGKEGQAIARLRAISGRRALLIVDYAETRAGLRQMLTALASDQGIAVRVLLLARSTGDWWDQLGAGEPSVWDLVQAAKSSELALSPIVAPGLSDADVIALAVRSFARARRSREESGNLRRRHGSKTGARSPRRGTCCSPERGG